MIRKLVRQMLTAQVFSALTVSLCLLIDNVMISRFLGEEYLAAFGLANPALLAIGAIGSLLAAGIQITCGKSLGKGSQEETNAGFSSATLVAAVISVAFMIGMLILSPTAAHVLGAGRNGPLFDQTNDYLKGFSIGAPGSMGSLVLVPFMQMAGQNGLLIVAVLSMTISDVALDLLSVTVFKEGMLGMGPMFGMGLASSLSYYIALAIGAVYFLSKRSVFRFHIRQVSWKKIGEIFRSGIPAGFTMGSTMIMVFLINRILRNIGASSALAAFAIILSIGNASYCISTGISGTSLTLAGIFYSEEDRTSLRRLIALLFRYSIVLGLAMGVILLIFAPAVIGLFIPEPGETQSLAILGLRIFAAGLIPCCMNNALKSMYQATGRVVMMEVLSLLEGALLPTLAAYVFSLLLGVNGAWLYSVVGELLTLGCIGLYVRLRTGKKPWKDGTYLLLRDSFGVPDDRLLEFHLHQMKDVADASRQVEEFCLQQGESAKFSAEMALCVEEMAVNVIQYGFIQDGKQHHLSIRILHKENMWVIRFRDDCGAFDPISYLPDDSKPHLGIRLVMALAREASYTYSLNLNNLILKLRAD
ncbi:MAG: ATP-binding protein [Clostridia bacterium]|nr:ATP-binding protein [Clostridia bacterium]